MAWPFDELPLRFLGCNLFVEFLPVISRFMVAVSTLLSRLKVASVGERTWEKKCSNSLDNSNERV